MKKTLDILGVVVSWILSIALVLMLIVTPIFFSAISLINTDTITQIVVNTLTAGQESQSDTENADSADAVLADLFGSQEQVREIVGMSKIVKELAASYTDDLANVITGGDQEASFNAEKIRSVVNEHVDELVDVLQNNAPQYADKSEAEIKNEILEKVDARAEAIVNALPGPGEIKQLLKDNPTLETIANLLAMKNTVKLAVVGAIVVLAGLIFACRLPGPRGFRWLAGDLFAAGGLNVFTTVGLLVSQTAVGEIAKESGPQIAAFIGALLGSFTTGMLVRTLVMLAFGGISLSVYILLKKQKEKKLATMQPVEEITAGGTQA